MVEGTINGFPFRAALEPNGKGSHRLRVNKVMHDAAGANAGDTVTVEITRAGEEPETRVPMNLRKALATAPLARALWADITPIARRDWILWISLSQATGNAQAPDRESLCHACIWKATSMLFWRYKVAFEKSRNIRQNMASVAELKKSFFAAIDKVENREGERNCFNIPVRWVAA